MTHRFIGLTFTAAAFVAALGAGCAQTASTTNSGDAHSTTAASMGNAAGTPANSDSESRQIAGIDPNTGIATGASSVNVGDTTIDTNARGAGVATDNVNTMGVAGAASTERAVGTDNMPNRDPAPTPMASSIDRESNVDVRTPRADRN